MSIIPASRLSRADVHRLGNNLQGPKRPLVRSRLALERRLIRAVNRSLAHCGERVGHLAPAGPPTREGGGRGC